MGHLRMGAFFFCPVETAPMMNNIQLAWSSSLGKSRLIFRLSFFLFFSPILIFLATERLTLTASRLSGSWGKDGKLRCRQPRKVRESFLQFVHRENRDFPWLGREGEKVTHSYGDPTFVVNRFLVSPLLGRKLFPGIRIWAPIRASLDFFRAFQLPSWQPDSRLD